MNKMYKSIVIDKCDKIFRIIFNRPAKKNAISDEMYLEITRALKEAADDKECLLTVFTGKGDYYCSGTDLFDIEPTEEYAKYAENRLRKYVGAYIDHPKPLVALVNGPALGIAVTVLGMFDLVYASDKATFLTPFTSLGLAPEGCSSYTFPKIMGSSKASEMLLFGKTLTADEACLRGLVTEVFPSETFAVKTNERIKRLAQLPPESVTLSRKLIRDVDRNHLHQVNDAECEFLTTRFNSEETLNAIFKFHSSKAKL